MGKHKHETDEEVVSGLDIILPLERLARITRAAEHDGSLNPAQWEALRFLAKANRYSNSPGALTRYLGATKGTVSQTIKALERKGVIAKSARAGEGRSLCLSVTPRGLEMLARDPWARLAQTIDGLGGKTRRRLAKGLGTLLDLELTRNGAAAFGACGRCRFFREKGRQSDPQGPHLCMLMDQAIAPSDVGRLCIHMEAR